MQKITIVSLIFIIMYFILVNMLSSFLIINPNLFSNKNVYSIGGTKINVGFSDKVSVSIKRVRWYGTIDETDNLSKLKIFKIIPIPIKVNGSSWVYYHLGVFAIFIFIVRKKLNKEEKKWESKNFGENT